MKRNLKTKKSKKKKSGRKVFFVSIFLLMGMLGLAYVNSVPTESETPSSFMDLSAFYDSVLQRVTFYTANSLGFNALFVIVLAVALVFIVLLEFRMHRKRRYKEHRYYGVSKLLTSEEVKFYRTLQTALLNSRLTVCPKVRLGDVVCVDGKRDRDWFSKFAKVSQKHLDFVLCDRKTMKIVCAIELDDPTHEWASSQKRDREKNAACKEAKISLLRYKTRRYYDAGSICTFLRRNGVRM